MLLSQAIISDYCGWNQKRKKNLQTMVVEVVEPAFVCPPPFFPLHLQRQTHARTHTKWTNHLPIECVPLAVNWHPLIIHAFANSKTKSALLHRSCNRSNESILYFTRDDFHHFCFAHHIQFFLLFPLLPPLKTWQVYSLVSFSTPFQSAVITHFPMTPSSPVGAGRAWVKKVAAT